MATCRVCGKAEAQPSSLLCRQCMRKMGLGEAAPDTRRSSFFKPRKKEENLFETSCCPQFANAFMAGAPLEHAEDCEQAGRDDPDFCVWTLVQHHLSKEYVKDELGEFRPLVNFVTAEVAEVRNPYVASDIEEKGGLIFQTKEEADARCQAENFPEFHEGPEAHVGGTFPNHQHGGRHVQVMNYSKSKRGRPVGCLVYIPYREEDEAHG